jgi:hypothetical protein
MAWLIRERSILKGQRDQCEKQLGELPRRIVELEQQLAAADAVILNFAPTMRRAAQPVAGG